MSVTRKQAITLLHDDYVSTIATWWKAFALAPAWLIPLLPAIGGAFYHFGIENAGIGALIFYCVAYFARDLLRKKIVIDERRIRHGFSSLRISEIESVEIHDDRYKIPNILVLKDLKGMLIKLYVLRLSADHLQALIDIVQKMSPQSKIDPQVDDILRRKRTQIGTPQDRYFIVSIPYHAERVWSDLPASFDRTLKSWSRIIGPVGVALICLPGSIWLFDFLYRVVPRNWSSYEQNSFIYNAIIGLIKSWTETQGDVLQTGLTLVSGQMDNPAVFGAACIIVLLALIGITRGLFCANRVTMDTNELSLDRWTYLFSFNNARLLWSDVIGVKLLRQGSKSELVFNLIANPKKTSHFHLDLNPIDGKDRAKLLQAIRRFAPHCIIDAEVIDLLEPTGAKSYTQLWLQSLTTAPEHKILEPIKSAELLDHGRYEVIRRLGVGGQGTAYLCYDLGHPELNRAPEVVLKETLIPLFVDSLLRQKTIERFVAEAKMLEKIQSPRVVKMQDYFIDSRGAYLVLEHIEGKTLRQLVGEQGALSLERVQALSVQMLEILSTLHSQEIIHRDFTPDNLILTPDEVLKLIDFNVAQEDSEGTTATIVGKHAYVPPEQFRGKACSQSDLYALGATLFYLATGDDPEPISQSSLPPEQARQCPQLAQIIQACTALELDERAHSAAELMSAVQGDSQISESWQEELPAADRKVDEDDHSDEEGTVLNIDVTPRVKQAAR